MLICVYSGVAPEEDCVAEQLVEPQMLLLGRQADGAVRFCQNSEEDLAWESLVRYADDNYPPEE